MSGINECTDLVDIRTIELSEQIKNTYRELDNRLLELDAKSRDDIIPIMNEQSSCNSGKIRNVLILNMFICILVLIILIKLFIS